jgi:hypothetical protein
MPDEFEGELCECCCDSCEFDDGNEEEEDVDEDDNEK